MIVNEEPYAEYGTWTTGPIMRVQEIKPREYSAGSYRFVIDGGASKSLTYDEAEELALYLTRHLRERD